VDVQTKGFGVWKIWAELQQRGRSWTFYDGPGLGVWQKPPALELPGFLEQLLAPPNEWNGALAKYYSERADELQRKIDEHWRDGTIRQTSVAQQTVIQVFHTKDGIHREEDSVYARVGHEGWKELRIELPEDAGASPLRVDFVTALNTIDIAWLRLTKGGSTCFSSEEMGFDTITLAGDVERLAHPTALRLRATGVDPQLYLPAVDFPANQARPVLEMRLQILTDVLAG
jgi:hypothetical protein